MAHFQLKADTLFLEQARHRGSSCVELFTNRGQLHLLIYTVSYRPCSFPSPRPPFGQISTRSGWCFYIVFLRSESESEKEQGISTNVTRQI